jgi:hypothetical protein
MSPVQIGPKSPCYTVLFLHFFRETLIQTERVLSVKGKVRFESQGPPRLREVVALKALSRAVDSEKRERGPKLGLTLTSLKSAAFVNLHLVIKWSE